MPKAERPLNSIQLPESCAAIPILEKEVGAILRVCVVVRTVPDPVSGHLILLRDLPQARVYLGCVVDQGEHPKEWVELWVQNIDGLQSIAPALRQHISNHGLDGEWADLAADFAALDIEGRIETGWEKRHPLPTFLDIGKQKPVHPGQPQQGWELCCDDARLTTAGLPSFSTSLARYLYQPANKESVFVPVSAEAPTNQATRAVTELLQGAQQHIPFNLQGGLLLAQKFCPIPFEDYVDLLGGKGWKGLESGKRGFQFSGSYSSLGDWNLVQQSGSHLFLGGQGRAGRFVETYHLKLQLLLDILIQARAIAARRQLPFLNLSGDSFRIRLEEVGTKLPVFWAAKANLVRPGDAVALPVESSEFQYFVRSRSNGASIYQPTSLNSSLQGTGSVRLRKVMPPDGNRTVLEATLVLQEKLQFSPNDLIWVRLPVGNSRVDLYGHLSATEGLAQGEARFRTLPLNFRPEVLAALKAAEGVSFPSSPFQIVPLLSTACDLYSLGVLAIRTFLVNAQNSLAVALDEVLSLGRQASIEHKADVPLHSRIGAILGADARFTQSLAPHRLIQEEMEPKAAYELIPGELWQKTLATMIRFFPGLVAESYCKDYGDAPALALETVFDQGIEELENLLVRSRSLIVIDWNANREIHSAIRDLRDRVG